MAAIATVRKYYGLVIVIIAVALFAFIISDAIQNNQSMFMGQDDSVGEIAGEKISYNEYRNMVNQAEKNYRENNEKASLSQEESSQLNDQVWEQMVTSRIMDEEYDRLGITIGREEMEYITVGPAPDPILQQIPAFRDSLGRFDKNQLFGFLQNMRNDPTGQAVEGWASVEEAIVNERLRRKYFDLLQKSQFVTDLDAELDYLFSNKNASIDYVALDINSIPDTAVNVTDSELRDYYKKNKDKYKQEEGRVVEYVAFDVRPSQKDSQRVLEALTALKKDFRQTTNDSAFVVGRSDNPEENAINWYSRGNLPDNISEEIFNADTGTVFGPYPGNGSYYLAKVSNIKEDSLYSVQASHILIKPDDGDTSAAMAEARDIMRQIKRGSDFEEMAQLHSEDLANASDGGDLGWFREGQMVGPFDKAVMNAKKGDLKVVKTQFGAHIIKVTEEKSNRMVQIALIERTLSPGTKTYQEIFSRANEFHGSIVEGEDFVRQANEIGLNRRTLPAFKSDERTLPGISRPRELIRWAYEAKEGDISPIMEMDDKTIVAHLVKASDEGAQSFENLREEIETEVLREKKRELLVKRLREANEGANDLNAIAQKAGTDVKSADNITFANPNIPGLGQEPKIIGAVFGAEPKGLSKPVEGDNFVVQFVVKRFSDVKMPESFDDVKKTLASDMEGRAQFEATEALKKAADVKDRRHKFF